MIRLIQTALLRAGFLVLLALAPSLSQAALKCEEMVANRVCRDSAPRTMTLTDGTTATVPAPTISGFSSPCWKWDRQFLCVEANPLFFCQSGKDFATVRNTCSLTNASINASVRVNSITYITDATYTYRCGFGEYETDNPLPGNKECVVLKDTVTDTTAPAAPTGTDPSSGFGNPPTTAPLTGTVVTDQKSVREYVCYDPPVTTCSNVCYKTELDPATGEPRQVEGPCAEDVVSQCTVSSTECKNTDVTSMVLGPDGRCVNVQETSSCVAGAIPRCLETNNCTLQSTAPSDIQPNGFALTQEQTYLCTNEVRQCVKFANVSNCMHVSAWGWDKSGVQSQMGEGLGQVNQAMSKMEAVQKGMNTNDPHIFSGQARSCKYAVGGWTQTMIMVAVVVASGGAAAPLYMQMAAAYTAATDYSQSKEFGSDCCKNYMVQGSDAWWSLGSRCTADEVKLGVARRKGLVKYIGEYCSKKNWIGECVERSRSYCAFDDMLAMVVNEQGRQQLDQIASADATTTKSTAPFSLPLYAPEIVASSYIDSGMANGGWSKITAFNNSQIWMWKYPGYCVSLEKQAEAYKKYQADITAATDTTGIQPGTMTEAQKQAYIAKLTSLPKFQECAETPGLVSFLTCGKNDDSCDPARLPEGPTATPTDISGMMVSNEDVNWRLQQVQSFYMPGDYGVTNTMSTDSGFAAMASSLNPFVTSVGSCHTDGSCLYSFAITDKLATGGLGAKKRASQRIQFPLYSTSYTEGLPTINYLSADGVLSNEGYAADTNIGLAQPQTVNTQRFVFHPNSTTTIPASGIHNYVLLDWSTRSVNPDNPRLDYTPILVPTSLPPATPGFYPYGNSADNKSHFYLSGGCDPNTRWCDYKVEVDLTVDRHPWGGGQSPRCWGFTMEQMAALDFDRMDLSQWINSLNLDQLSGGMTGEAAKAMADQATASSQALFTSFKDGTPIEKPVAGSAVLVLNTDILPMQSSTEESSYTVRAAVPANWPKWFDSVNDNPVSNVWVDWGNGTPKTSMSLVADGRAFTATHDYGGFPPGTYKITVTLDTAGNGPQVLSTNVRIQQNAGDARPASKLDFNNEGSNNKAMGSYIPSSGQNGADFSAQGTQTIAPGMTELFTNQGSAPQQITPPPAP